jgi:hypothetical protein
MLKKIRYALSQPFFVVGLLIMTIALLCMGLAAWIQGEQQNQVTDEHIALFKGDL